MATSSPALDHIEATLRDLIPDLCPALNPRGRPEILPGALLWLALLVCILRQTTSQRALWRLLCQVGLWDFPWVPVTAEAVRIRLQRTGPACLAALYHQVTAAVADHAPTVPALAPFAAGVYAIDESTLDQVTRTSAAVRGAPPGDDRLLPGKIRSAFDLRTQHFATIRTTTVPRQNEKVAARELVATLPAGSLILADLGYFGFRWFDDLTDRGNHYLSKLRAGTSYVPLHILTEQAGVRDELAWLGKYRANRAKHIVRIITVTRGTHTQRYVTNVRDPRLLSVAEAVRIYGLRWTIEEAFALIKNELGLETLWSASSPMIQTQLWGVLIIAQIALAVRGQIAAQAHGDDPDDMLGPARRAADDQRRLHPPTPPRGAGSPDESPRAPATPGPAGDHPLPTL